ncbi:Phosphoglycerate dehydrogenase [Halobacillus alkaliphilus]|uniref:Phosphoglycerate dehydrogenase n=1 Tax=Halobacillus alkaliphilus TaxID=396056 RepID=A0A1I2JXD8_9BACI|nr:NAD(P)-dependent oxidoreductase [Halobacillus alkaliphilus]SFF58738.1 Phosphoglycerate dehydrogenase [Halobacillus alkaliphilus]
MINYPEMLPGVRNINLLITGAYNYTNAQVRELESMGFEIIHVQEEREPLQIDVSNIHGVICNSLFLYNDISEFKNLKFVQLTSAGLDRIPLDYIKEMDIKLFNAKGVYSIPMAEWAILKILEIYKKSKDFYKQQYNKEWIKQRDLLELYGKTAAIIGLGDVGNEIAKRLKVFGVKVLAVGRTIKHSHFIDEYYLNYDLNNVLSKSDIVILTLPLTSETHYLFDANRITFMKENSVLINLSRGGIINELALMDSIQNGKFSGVSLDVFEEEPLQESSILWENEKVFVTPHNSFISDNVMERMFTTIKENLNSITIPNKL